MRKPWLLPILLLAAACKPAERGGADAGRSQGPPAFGPETLFRVPLGHSPTTGPADARVTAVVFAGREDTGSAAQLRLLRRFQERHRDEFRMAIKYLNEEENARLARRLGVVAPPVVFLNGRRYPVEADTELASAFEREARRAKALLDRGVPAKRLYDELIRQGKVSAWFRDVKVGRRKGAIKGQGAVGDGEREPPKTVDVKPGQGPWLGPPEAPVQVVLFADLACEFCPRMIPRLRELHEAFPRDVFITLRLLTPPGRKELRDAELAVVASAGQKQTWDFVDRVFKHDGDAGRETLFALANGAGLDVDRLKKDLGTPAVHLGKLQANQAEAERVGASSRPCVFVQGRMLPGAAPTTMLKRLVKQALESRPQAPDSP